MDQDKGGNSVTNDIRNVLNDIYNLEGEFLLNMPVIYRDSDGIWDAVNGWPGQLEFLPLREFDQEKAIYKYLNYLHNNGKLGSG